MNYTREQRLAHSRNTINSADWKWLKSELEKASEQRKLNVNTVINDNTIYNAGVVAGIEYCVNFPQIAFETNQKIVDKMIDLMMGEKNKKQEEYSHEG